MIGTLPQEEREDAYYKALLSRDTRFDGLFFVGVESTGIYCRPICPVKPPKRANCHFFHHPAEAEKEGFRACFRCRPERAPGDGSVDARSRLTAHAIEQINAGYLNEHTVGDLAARLGVSDRHLRRTIQAELGLTPTALAQSRRLAMAKQLLQETKLPITQVAFASGFSSVRQFNTAFRARFDRPPSSLRKEKAREGACADEAKDTLTLQLAYRPPLPWSLMMAQKERRLMQGIEAIEGDTYRRAVRGRDTVGWLALTPATKSTQHVLLLTLSSHLFDEVIKLQAQVRRLFDLDARPEDVAAHLQRDPRLGPKVKALPGLRLFGAFDRFAQLVRIIIGQRISVQAATTIFNRLIQTQGTPIETPFEGLTHVFPTPQELASCSPDELASIGIPKARVEALQSLARALSEGSLCLETDTLEELAEALLAIKGIGPWTVQTAQMRLFGHPDTFPASDLVLRQALGHVTTKEAEAIATPWRPWRAYAAMYLWAAPPQEEESNDTLFI